jgi:chromosome segregation ATPase
MNRRLQYLNLFGVLALAGLCIFQWRMNRQLNLEVNQLEKSRIEQTVQFDEQSKKLKGTTEDLEAFRGQLTRANVSLKEQIDKSAGDETKIENLTVERDELKTALVKWTNAVAERDQRLKESNAQIQKLADDLNAAVVKYNQLATNYNSVVNDLNELRSKTAPTNK